MFVSEASPLSAAKALETVADRAAQNRPRSAQNPARQRTVEQIHTSRLTNVKLLRNFSLFLFACREIGKRLASLVRDVLPLSPCADDRTGT